MSVDGEWIKMMLYTSIYISATRKKEVIEAEGSMVFTRGWGAGKWGAGKHGAGGGQRAQTSSHKMNKFWGF